MSGIPTTFSGKDGMLWFNGQVLAWLKSVEAKVTGNFDDLEVCNVMGTIPIYKGFSCEGTLVLHKVNSEVLKLMAPAFKSGIMPPLKLISKHENKGAGYSERIVFHDVVITEVMLAKFTAGEVTEESIPFKFTNYEILAA